MEFSFRRKKYHCYSIDVWDLVFGQKLTCLRYLVFWVIH